MKWERKGWISPKLVSEDGKWEIFDGEFGHAALRRKETRKGFLLKATSATSQNAIDEAEDKIKDWKE